MKRLALLLFLLLIGCNNLRTPTLADMTTTMTIHGESSVVIHWDEQTNHVWRFDYEGEFQWYIRIFEHVVNGTETSVCQAQYPYMKIAAISCSKAEELIEGAYQTIQALKDKYEGNTNSLRSTRLSETSP